jgi:hypothetical protein
MAHVTHHHSSEHHAPPVRTQGSSARRWQDWTNMVLGLLLVASPWLLRFTGLEAATLNAVIIGFLIFALSALALTLLDRWEAYINGLLGLWAVLSPWLIGFTAYDYATIAHVGIGALVVIVAAIEIWQTGAPDAV